MRLDIESVKGSSGYWHGTYGQWENHNKLATLCRRAISPNNRRMSTREVDCPGCLRRLAQKDFPKYINVEKEEDVK